jgi:hypothetical protein
MKARLDYIESRLQGLIEKTLKRLGADSAWHPLSHQLVIAMQDNLYTLDADSHILEGTGRLIAPQNYIILLNPQDLLTWQSNAGLLDSLKSTLEEAAREAGVYFEGPLNIRMVADANIPPGDVRVEALTHTHSFGTTGSLPLYPDKNREAADPRPHNAFLIVYETTFPLRLVVVNIGRRPDNHLIIDDQRVSREHAQLRAVQGHYILFDLNATGGTYVNGQRITQYILKPGDVISLAGVPVIYGEDNLLDDDITGGNTVGLPAPDENSHG